MLLLVVYVRVYDVVAAALCYCAFNLGHFGQFNTRIDEIVYIWLCGFSKNHVIKYKLSVNRTLRSDASDSGQHKCGSLLCYFNLLDTCIIKCKILAFHLCLAL